MSTHKNNDMISNVNGNRISRYVPACLESFDCKITARIIETIEIIRNANTTTFEPPFTLMYAITNGISAVAMF